MSRAKVINSKAANLSSGLRFASLPEGGASEFFAVLDVNTIPELEFLSTLLPHMLKDGRAAVVSSPQNYYDTPEENRCGKSMFFIKFFDIIMPLLDQFNNA